MPTISGMSARVESVTMTNNLPVFSRHPEDIKAAVRKRGKTLRQLALDAGLWESACREALIKPTTSGNRAIAAFLGCHVHDLWPQWFNTDGSRKPARKGDAA